MILSFSVVYLCGFRAMLTFYGQYSCFPYKMVFILSDESIYFVDKTVYLYFLLIKISILESGGTDLFITAVKTINTRNGKIFRHLFLIS